MAYYEFVGSFESISAPNCLLISGSKAVIGIESVTH